MLMLNKYNTWLLDQLSMDSFPNQTLKMSKKKQSQIKAIWRFLIIFA